MDSRPNPKRSLKPDVSASEIDPAARRKVVPLRRDQSETPLERLHPRLEEFRRILANAEPIDDAYSDDEVTGDEKKFRKRFGPGFTWNHRDRVGLIALKKRYDLTDPEIRMFHYTGNLHRSVFGVRITASPSVALWGAGQIAVVGLLFLALLLPTWPNFVAAPEKMITPMLALLGLIGFGVVLHWLSVRPWLLQRRKERERRDEGR